MRRDLRARATWGLGGCMGPTILGFQGSGSEPGGHRQMCLSNMPALDSPDLNFRNPGLKAESRHQLAKETLAQAEKQCATAAECGDFTLCRLRIATIVPCPSLGRYAGGRGSNTKAELTATAFGVRVSYAASGHTARFCGLCARSALGDRGGGQHQYEP